MVLNWKSQCCKALLTLPIGILLAASANAQVISPQNLPIQTNPGQLTPSPSQQIPTTPDPEKERLLPSPDQILDETVYPERPVEKRYDDTENISFLVKDIQIEGNTVFSDIDIEPLVGSYENRTVTLAELYQLVDAINKLYYDHGYYTSQAYIPPQDIDQKTVIIQVQEGKVGELSVVGNRFWKSSSIQRDLGYAAGERLNVKHLEQSLNRMNQMNRYYVKGTLEAGDEKGKTDIRLKVLERFPWQLSPTFDNQGRPYIGTYRWGVDVENNNLTGIGDRLTARWIRATGTQVAASSYFMPVNRYGTEIGATFGFSRVDVDLDTPNPPEIIGHAYDYGAVILQPLDKERHFVADSTLNLRRVITIINQDRASQDNIAVLRFGLSYNDSDLFGRTSLRLQTSIAPGWLGANRKFWKNEVSGTRVFSLPYQNLLILRGTAQMTPDALPSAEMMQIGGAFSVRGYSEGLQAGNRGYSFGIEHRWPIPGLNHLSPWLNERVQGASFFDMGQVWVYTSSSNSSGGRSNQRERTLLAGAGVGVRARLSRYLQGFVDFGFGLVNHSGIEPNAQPVMRVHFGVRSNLLPEEFRDWTVNTKVTSPNPPPLGRPLLTPAEVSPK